MEVARAIAAGAIGCVGARGFAGARVVGRWLSAGVLVLACAGTAAGATTGVVDGDVGPVLIWHALLVPGEYDIVIDANQNGVYDTPADGLDSGSHGFVVIAGSVLVPTLAPIGIITLIGLLCVIGMIRIRRRFN